MYIHTYVVVEYVNYWVTCSSSESPKLLSSCSSSLSSAKYSSTSLFELSSWSIVIDSCGGTSTGLKFNKNRHTHKLSDLKDQLV